MHWILQEEVPVHQCLDFEGLSPGQKIKNYFLVMVKGLQFGGWGVGCGENRVPSSVNFTETDP